MSDHIKEKWELMYYAQVMAMLGHVKSGGKDICGVTPEMAGRIMDALFTYSHIDLYDCPDATKAVSETTVRVSMFSYELMRINTLWGFMMAGGMPGFTLSFDLDNDYARAMIKKTEDYIKAQNEKRDSCLQAIRDYVAECEAAGTKPVKKRVVERTGLGYDYVREVWQLFDRERDGG